MKSWVLLAAAALLASCTCRTQIPQQVDTVTPAETRTEEREAEGSQAPELEAQTPPQVEQAPEAETPSPPRAERAEAPAAQSPPPAEGSPQRGEAVPGEGAPAGEQAPESGPGEPKAGSQTPPGEPPDAEPTSAGEQSFVVSEEVYNKTFDEVEEFVRTLNDIIRRRDYATWLTFLTEDYISEKSDPEYLRKQSEMPTLKKNNIVLNSLQDYFQYVVVPSRSQATIDDIEFLDENHVKAITSIRGTRGILYLLERKDGGWKIGVWE